MKLLFIHEVNYETKVIFEIHEFPELLALKGHEIDFLHFPEGAGFKNRKIRATKKRINGRVYESASINLITPTNFGGNFLDRLISTITVIPILWRLISKKNYDAVVLYSVPTSGWQTALISKIKKVPVVFRALDVSNQLRSRLTKNLVITAEKIVLRNVNLVSANNEALAKYCSKISGRNVLISVDFPPVDLDHFNSPSQPKISRSELGLTENDIVLAYMGTFYQFSGLEQVIEQLVLDEFKSFKLLLIGGGESLQSLKDLVERLQLKNRVIFTGVVPYEQLPAYLKTANVLFNSFRPELVSNLALPHKVLQYLALGLPTISTQLDGLYFSLKNEAGVYWVKQPSEILSKAGEVMNLSVSNIQLNVLKGKEFVTNNFSKELAVQNFEKTIKKSIGS